MSRCRKNPGPAGRKVGCANDDAVWFPACTSTSTTTIRTLAMKQVGSVRQVNVIRFLEGK
jgi:hypothetical protein